MRDLLAHVPFRGPIRERSVEPFLPLLRGLRARSRVKGVLFDISSGGGEVVASSDLFLALRRLDAVKPVFVSIGSLGASGAYLAALGGRRIFAYPESHVGSIGVLYPHLAVQELLRRLGISVELLHVGAYKDAFQGYRPLTEEERGKLQGIAQESFDEFVRRVAEGRHRTVEEIRALATGEFWTGRRALELGLVDELGDREEALGALARATGVPARRVVRLLPPRPLFERLISGGAGYSGLRGRLRETLEDALFDVGAGYRGF